MDWEIPVRVWLVEMQCLEETCSDKELDNLRRVRKALLDHGYIESRWSTKLYCDEVPGLGVKAIKPSTCTKNAVFEHPKLVIDLDLYPKAKWDNDATFEKTWPQRRLEGPGSDGNKRPPCCGCEPLARAVAAELRRQDSEVPPPLPPTATSTSPAQ